MPVIVYAAAHVFADAFPSSSLRLCGNTSKGQQKYATPYCRTYLHLLGFVELEEATVLIRFDYYTAIPGAMQGRGYRSVRCNHLIIRSL